LFTLIGRWNTRARLSWREDQEKARLSTGLSLHSLTSELAVLIGILHGFLTLTAARILLLLTGLLAATLLLLAGLLTRVLVLLARILVLVAHVGNLPG